MGVTMRDAGRMQWNGSSRRAGRGARRWLGAAALGGCAVDDRVAGVIDDAADEPSSPGAIEPGPAPAPGGDAPQSGGPASGAAGAAAPPGLQVAVAPEGAPAGGGADATGGAAGGPEPLPAPTPPAPGVCGEQLLANGDFDQGPGAGWDVTFDARAVLVPGADPALVARGVSPQSGEFLAWRGGIRNGEYGFEYTTRIEQSISIPANATRLTFSGCE